MTSSNNICNNVHETIDLKVGDQFSITHQFSVEDTQDFAKLSLDYARVHQDRIYARNLGYSDVIVYGHLTIMPLSRMIGMELPGEGWVLKETTIQFRQAIYTNEDLVYTLKVRRIRPQFRIVDLDLEILGDRGRLLTGQCQCMSIQPKISS